MQSVKSKIGIIIAAFLCVLVIGTCSLVRDTKDKVPQPIQDTMLSYWKKEKQQLQLKYEGQITALEASKDSLQTLVTEKKKALFVYRRKAAILEDQLRQAITKVDSSRVFQDSLSPLANEYFDTHSQADSSCDSIVRSLEQIAANRDSAIVIFRQKENVSRELQKEQELRNQILTEQLKTAYKEQKRKVKQNKLLAVGLIFLSGLTTSVLIQQSLK
jgi:hypothetical protein